MGSQLRLVRSYLAALLVAVSLASPAMVRAVSGAEASSIPENARHIHIDNFGSVNATYYRGAQPEGRDFADLATLGVKTVIDFQKDGDPTEQAQVEREGMRFVRIPMTTRIVPTPEQLTQFLSIVEDPKNQPVFVHCAGGRHRTGVMTAVYRMVKEGWPADRAFSEMKQFKFGSDFLHPEFKSFVYAFHPDRARTTDAATVVATQ